MQVANYRQERNGIYALFLSSYKKWVFACLVCFWLSTDIFALPYMNFNNPSYFLTLMQGYWYIIITIVLLLETIDLLHTAVSHNDSDETNLLNIVCRLWFVFVVVSFLKEKHLNVSHLHSRHVAVNIFLIVVYLKYGRQPSELFHSIQWFFSTNLGFGTGVL